MKIVKHITIRYIHFFLILSLSLISFPAISAGEITDIDLTGTWPGITALIVFIFAYVLVIGEETNPVSHGLIILKTDDGFELHLAQPSLAFVTDHEIGIFTPAVPEVFVTDPHVAWADVVPISVFFVNRLDLPGMEWRHLLVLEEQALVRRLSHGDVFLNDVIVNGGETDNNEGDQRQVSAGKTGPVGPA